MVLPLEVLSANGFFLRFNLGTHRRSTRLHSSAQNYAHYFYCSAAIMTFHASYDNTAPDEVNTVLVPSPRSTPTQ